MTDKTFSDLGVSEPLCKALAGEGYTSPTPIQLQSIPSLLAGKDLLGIAETGTGKTAAFALPLLQKLAAVPGRPRPKVPRALILAPTRELAVQIHDSIRIYGRHLRLFSTSIFGGVGQGNQVRELQRGVDILIATPGRLLDLCGQRHVDLSAVSVLILDEADRMLDMGFVRDVRKIVAMTPKQRQSLLFSATMPGDIAELSAEILHNPVRVEIARAGKTVDRIEQRVHHVSAAAKKELLTRLLADPAMSRVMVFTRTKRGANRVSEQLEKAGINADAIHGNKSQSARQKALDGFKTGKTRVLVATDIAARGLDIEEVTHVINYELPHEPESYVHRIGRTARAGADGIAIAFCAPDERAQLRDIERLTRQPLTVVGTAAPAGSEPRSGGERGARPQRDGGQRQEHRNNRGRRSDEGRERHGRPADRRHGDGQPRREERGRGGDARHPGSARPATQDRHGARGGETRDRQARHGGQGRPHQGRHAGSPTPWAGWSSRRADQ